ncbi:MAG: type II secretion system F family protein [Clostridia bacterium]
MIFFVFNLGLCIWLILSFTGMKPRDFIPVDSLEKGVLVLCAGVFLFTGTLLNMSLDHVFASFALSLVPASIPYVILDIRSNYRAEREQKQIVSLLMLLSRWSCVKNDLMFCLQKAAEAGLKKPLGETVGNAVARIRGGMETEEAMGLMENESLGEDFRYVVKNIRIAALKGGDISHLFQNLEEQFFRISEETYKRKISTFRDRVFVYVVILLVLWVGFVLVAQNPSASQFYLGTPIGKNLAGAFGMVFFLTGMLYLRK